MMPALLSARSAVSSGLMELDRKATIVVRVDGTFCGVVCEASFIAAIARQRQAAFDQAVRDTATDLRCSLLPGSLHLEQRSLASQPTGRC